MSSKVNDINFINAKTQNKFVQYQDIEKNEKKVKQTIVNTCSQTCFENLKTDFVSNNENFCLSKCFKKFSDSLFLGEQIYESLNKNNLTTTLIANGRFDQFVAEAKNQFDL